MGGQLSFLNSEIIKIEQISRLNESGVPKVYLAHKTKNRVNFTL